MGMEDLNFKSEGLVEVNKYLDQTDERYHPTYLSSFVCQVGLNIRVMPTRKNETKVLTRLNEALLNRIPQRITEKTLDLLAQNRMQRMEKCAEIYLGNTIDKSVISRIISFFHFEKLRRLSEEKKEKSKTEIKMPENVR